MSDLRQAASFALTTLHGWSAHDHWLWPESALAQAKQNTAEAIPLLEAALAESEPEGPTSDLNKPQEAKDESNKPTDEELVKTVKQSMEDCIFISELLYYNREPLIQILRAVLARWGK